MGTQTALTEERREVRQLLANRLWVGRKPRPLSLPASVEVVPIFSKKIFFLKLSYCNNFILFKVF
jgi:hypothetical protein